MSAKTSRVLFAAGAVLLLGFVLVPYLFRLAGFGSPLPFTDAGASMFVGLALPSAGVLLLLAAVLVQPDREDSR